MLFVLWERHLERVHEQGGSLSQRWWTPPPLMPVSIWWRANGKLAAMLGITFLEWCSFNVFTFWVQVGFRESFEPRVLALNTYCTSSFSSCTTRTTSA